MSDTSKLTGGCLCGSVRFHYDGALGSAGYCHCTDCRKCTGSAFNVSVAVQAKHFSIMCGAPKGFAKMSDSGTELTRHFCAECGSPLFTSSPSAPEWLYVKAGAFDDPSLIVPAYQCWTSSAVAWARIAVGLRSFEHGRLG